MQLDTVFTSEIIVLGFYERNFPLTRKALCDARWKSAARELGMEVSQVAKFQADICKLQVQSKGILTSKHQQFNPSLKETPAPVHEKVVIYVPGFYENKQPWTRKAFHMARMASEVMGEEAVGGGPEKVQASREIEGHQAINVTVGHVTAVSELREVLHTVPVSHLNQNSLPSQLPPVESHNSRKPCINKGVMDLVEDLFPIQVPMKNLFDIQINEIYVDLNRFNELPSMKGNTTNTLNEYFDSAQKQNAHHNTRSMCKSAESPIMEFTHIAPKISTL